MRVTLDRHVLFDEQQLEIKADSFNRDFVETAISGLDGVLSVDMGRGSRKVQQRGSLRAKSRSQMNDRISAISTFIDGKMHSLVTACGEEFDNLRMDSFRVDNERTDGGSMVVDYEIIYTQLA